MDRRLPLILLLFLPALAFSQISQTSFSLPGVGDLQKQLTQTDSKKEDGTPNLDKARLERTLALRKEIDLNEEKIKSLQAFSAKAPSERIRLEAELTRARNDKETNWSEQYADQSLESLVQTLVAKLDDLEKNQQGLAEASSNLTRAQTLPEQAQSAISKAMDRMDAIRVTLNQGEDDQGEPLSDVHQVMLNTELQALESRINRFNQELAVVDKSQDIARLQQQLYKLEQNRIEAQLDALQPLINERRSNQLEALANAPDAELPEDVLNQPQVLKAREKNRALREQLARHNAATNELLRTAVNTKTELDKARALSTTVNDQIRMLEGSLLLSRILYEQQKSLPQSDMSLDLKKDIANIRISQFELDKEIRALDDSPLPARKELEDNPSPELEKAFSILREERLALYDQLDREISRQLAILTRTQLNHQQLEKISRSLHTTISEQTFWMPSTQPLSLEWLAKLPRQIVEQVASTPWEELLQLGKELLTSKWPLLIAILVPSALLLILRRRLKKHIATMNKDVGHLRRDSQLHTPLSLLYTVLIASPIPLFLVLFGTALWQLEGNLTSVFGSALVQLALLWFVFEFLYRVLKTDGIAQRHFRWSKEGNHVMRRRLVLTGLALIPVLLIVSFGDYWPALLSNDRVGLVIMLACMLVIAISLPSVAQSYPARNVSRTMKGLITAVCVLAPLALVVLTGIGYYYTSVRLAGHMIYSLYLIALWVVLDATAVRGLAVAAQRLSYKRMLAQREAEQKETTVSEAVEVEEPKLDLKQVNQQSLRLIRLALFAAIGLLVYWVWAEVLHAFAYTDSIVLWETTDMVGQTEQMSAISLGDVMAALVIGAVTFLLASNLPGLLEVLVLSRLDLRQGTSYATTTLLSYVIVASGIIITLGALGLSWDKMQWLVAALGVGLGFGLQEIFANFISGIIILFERPIRIGDVITIGNLDGTASRIRIRATTIIDFDRKEIIVPNKAFVTERLINWSLSDTVTRIIIKVGFAYGSDLEKCREILLKAARENKRVLGDPEPVVFFLTFGASTLDHELRVHVRDISDRLAATDELNRRIDALCKEAGVEIAFSQLDIHIRRDDGETLCIEGEKQPRKDDSKDSNSDEQS